MATNLLSSPSVTSSSSPSLIPSITGGVSKIIKHTNKNTSSSSPSLSFPRYDASYAPPHLVRTLILRSVHPSVSPLIIYNCLAGFASVRRIRVDERAKKERGERGGSWMVQFVPGPASVSQIKQRLKYVLASFYDQEDEEDGGEIEEEQHRNEQEEETHDHAHIHGNPHLHPPSHSHVHSPASSTHYWSRSNLKAVASLSSLTPQLQTIEFRIKREGATTLTKCPSPLSPQNNKTKAVTALSIQL